MEFYLLFSAAFYALAQDYAVAGKISDVELRELKASVSAYEKCVGEKRVDVIGNPRAVICEIPVYAINQTNDALICPRGKGYVPDFFERDGEKSRSYFYYCENSEIHSITLKNIKGNWIFWGAGIVIH